MFQPSVRKVLVACTLAATCAWPAESQACWLFGHHKRTTYMPVVAAAPVVAAPACSPCQPQVTYMPQTCYQQVCTQVPVTTCRPVTVCDPCTGCPTTVMRPVTTYVAQRVVVPYTTYRPVYAAAYAAAPACPTGGCATGGCPTGNCGVSATSYFQPATLSQPGSCCTPTSASYSAPAMNYSNGAATYNGSASSGYPTNGYPTNGYPTNGYPTNGYPTNGYPANGYNSGAPAANPSTSPQSTFGSNGANGNSQGKPLQSVITDQAAPPAEPNHGSNPGGDGSNGAAGPNTMVPRLLDPHNKTAARTAPGVYMPIHRPLPTTSLNAAAQPAQFVPAAASNSLDRAADQDADGWRTANR